MKRLTCVLFSGALWMLSADARAVTIQWSPVGNPGNANDPATGSLYGGVGYSYNIGTYDVTNSQYAEFLNIKDPTGANTLGLWNANMASTTLGGINFNAGNANGNKYTLIPGGQNHPVNYVTWYDTVRFANWLNNGQGNGDTESGAYTLLGGTPTPSNGDSITRNTGANVFLPSENEWYKAAYYDPRTTAQGGPPSDSHYWLYGTSSSSTPIASGPTALANHVNYNGVVSNLTHVDAYSGTTSPYGAFGMAGNVFQWNEALISGSYRGFRGGSFLLNMFTLQSSARGLDYPTDEYGYFGFRVATVPEPSTFALAICGVLGLLTLRKRRQVARAAIMLSALTLLAADARAVTIDWTPVGNPGNANDSTGYGAVGYSYSIDKYDVTNSQYVEFLNAKDPTGTSPLQLYNSNMSYDYYYGGINYNSGNANGSKYSVIAGAGDHPVNYVTWYDSLRFANWLNNGQGNGDTETGAYTLLGGTPTPSNGLSITRNAGATVFLPSENEWYKAAYYNPNTSSYYQYPTSSNTVPTASSPTAAPNSANFYPGGTFNLTDVGAYSGTTSPYGAFDMGGNVYQWNEALVSSPYRGYRGGSFFSFSSTLRSSTQFGSNPPDHEGLVGFRVASVPEPSTFALAVCGVLGLLALRKRRQAARAAIVLSALILFVADAPAVTINTVPVGDPGNPADNQVMFDGTSGYGAVAYDYRIGATEVTNAQYAEFLNAKAASDPLRLYNTNMDSDAAGGITRSGSGTIPDPYVYTTKINMADKPVNFVSWYDAIRFANWLNNGQGSGDTETGAYTLGQLDEFAVPINGSSITRNAGATWVLPSENEWYKAAYYQPAAQGGDTDNYWLYPTASNTTPTVAAASSSGDISNPGVNVVNYGAAQYWYAAGNVTTVGSAGPLSESYYGTSDQGGNVREWTEGLIGGEFRSSRGGTFYDYDARYLQSSGRLDFGFLVPAGEGSLYGFRVATVPEPSTFALAALGIVGILLLRPHRRSACAGVILLATTIVTSTTSSAVAGQYALTDLGYASLAFGINAFGQVTGTTSELTGNYSHAFLYDGAMHDLGTLGETTSVGRGINSSGQVTGDALTTGMGPNHAFLYDGVMHDLGTLGGTTSAGYGINDAGQVTGSASTTGDAPPHAFLYDGVMRDLGTLGGTTSGGYGINDAGRVTGSASTTGDAPPHAFLYDGVMHDLGTLGGTTSAGYGINDAGQVTGSASTTGDAPPHAFLYDGVMHDLGTLGGTFSLGRGVNASGQVTGWSSTAEGLTHAFLYDDGVMIDLNSLISLPSGWTLLNGEGINNAGQITGVANVGGKLHGFLLTPVPEPSTIALAALGIVGLLALRKRRRDVCGLMLAFSLTLLAADARAVTIDWTPVGNPGNANDSTGYGAVGYSYSIDKYDVTNSQYVEFLNAKDPIGTSPLQLYNSNMSDPIHGGINYNSGNSNGSKYSVIAGAGNHPVNYVTWYDTLRFANWLDNGQGSGDTETGAYTLLGGTATPSNGLSITRNAGANIFLPSENEWYKAAYYNPNVSSYYQYGTGSNTSPTASGPTGLTNHANYGAGAFNLTNVGAYTGTTSAYGEFDMGGNVFQWNEALIGSSRGLRGGSIGLDAAFLLSSTRVSFGDPSLGADTFGFRVATVPEPSSLILAALGLIGFAAWGWRRRRCARLPPESRGLAWMAKGRPGMRAAGGICQMEE